MPRRGGSDLLLPGILFTVHLGQNHSAMLYHPLQIEQKNLIRYLTRTEMAFGQYHIYMNHLERLKTFTATIWAFSFPHTIYLWAHII